MGAVMSQTDPVVAAFLYPAKFTYAQLAREQSNVAIDRRAAWLWRLGGVRTNVRQAVARVTMRAKAKR
jgi:hypothetical protein